MSLARRDTNATLLENALQRHSNSFTQHEARLAKKEDDLMKGVHQLEAALATLGTQALEAT